MIDLVGGGIATLTTAKMAASFSSFFLLMLSLLKTADIYRRLRVPCHTLPIVAALLVGWQFFMIAQRWMLSISFSSPRSVVHSGDFPSPQLLWAHISITIATILLAFIPSVPLLISLKEEPKIIKGKNKDLSLFVESMGKLIGGSAITILVNAIESYNKIHGTSLGFDRNRGVFVGDVTDDVTAYVVEYFSDLIGPIAKRLYAESRSRISEKE